MEKQRCSKCKHEAVGDETMWDLGAGTVLCDPCHEKWLKEEGPKEEPKRESKAVVMTSGKPESDSVVMTDTDGTSVFPSPEMFPQSIPEPPERQKLPNERQGFTHKFTILAKNPDTGEPENVKGYLTVGLYPDGRVGEIFVKMAKQGSQVSGFVDAWAISVSMMLQLGVPLKTLVDRFENMRFEPSGRIEGQSVFALSPVDYVCGYLRYRFLDGGARGGSGDAA